MKRPNLTHKPDVINLMASANTPKQWRLNRQAVVKANGGKLPNFWKEPIIEASKILE